VHDHILKFICLKTKYWFWKNKLEQIFFKEKPSCKSESEVYPEADWSESEDHPESEDYQKLKCRPWSQLLWLFEDTKMQKRLEDWRNNGSEKLEGFGCLFSEKGQWRTNSTIVQPLPMLLQHFMRRVQATVVSLLDWNG